MKSYLFAFSLMLSPTLAFADLAVNCNIGGAIVIGTLKVFSLNITEMYGESGSAFALNPVNGIKLHGPGMKFIFSTADYTRDAGYDFKLQINQLRSGTTGAYLTVVEYQEDGTAHQSEVLHGSCTLQ